MARLNITVDKSEATQTLRRFATEVKQTGHAIQKNLKFDIRTESLPKAITAIEKLEEKIKKTNQVSAQFRLPSEIMREILAVSTSYEKLTKELDRTNAAWHRQQQIYKKVIQDHGLHSAQAKKAADKVAVLGNKIKTLIQQSDLCVSKTEELVSELTKSERHYGLTEQSIKGYTREIKRNTVAVGALKTEEQKKAQFQRVANRLTAEGAKEAHEYTNELKSETAATRKNLTEKEKLQKSMKRYKSEAMETALRNRAVAEATKKVNKEFGELDKRGGFLNSRFAKFSIIMSGIAATLFVFQSITRWVREFYQVGVELEEVYGGLQAKLEGGAEAAVLLVRESSKMTGTNIKTGSEVLLELEKLVGGRAGSYENTANLIMKYPGMTAATAARSAVYDIDQNRSRYLKYAQSLELGTAGAQLKETTLDTFRTFIEKYKDPIIRFLNDLAAVLEKFNDNTAKGMEKADKDLQEKLRKRQSTDPNDFGTWGGLIRQGTIITETVERKQKLFEEMLASEDKNLNPKAFESKLSESLKQSLKDDPINVVKVLNEFKTETKDAAENLKKLSTEIEAAPIGSIEAGKAMYQASGILSGRHDVQAIKDVNKYSGFLGLKRQEIEQRHIENIKNWGDDYKWVADKIYEQELQSLKKSEESSGVFKTLHITKGDLQKYTALFNATGTVSEGYEKFLKETTESTYTQNKEIYSQEDAEKMYYRDLYADRQKLRKNDLEHEERYYNLTGRMSFTARQEQEADIESRYKTYSDTEENKQAKAAEIFALEKKYQESLIQDSTAYYEKTGQMTDSYYEVSANLIEKKYELLKGELGAESDLLEILEKREKLELRRARLKSHDDFKEGVNVAIEELKNQADDTTLATIGHDAAIAYAGGFEQGIREMLSGEGSFSSMMESMLSSIKTQVSDVIYETSFEGTLDAASGKISESVNSLVTGLTGKLSGLFGSGGIGGMISGGLAGIAVGGAMKLAGSAIEGIKGWFRSEQVDDWQYALNYTDKYKSTVLGNDMEASESIVHAIEILESVNVNSLYELRGIYSEIKDLNSNLTGVSGDIVRSFGGFSGADLGLGGSSKSFLSFSKSSTSVERAGLQVGGGTVQQILDGADTLVQMFARLKETSSSFWGLSKHTVWKTEYQAVEPEVQQAFNAIFANIGNTMVEMAKMFGTDNLEEIYRYTFDVSNIDLKDMTGDEIQDTLVKWASEEGDKAIRAFFGTLIGEYQALNEGILETAVRLATDVAEVGRLFSMLDRTLPDNMAEKLAFVEDLVDMAGGLEAFSGSAEKFYDLFTSDTDKLHDLTDSLQALWGGALPATREEFAAVVKTMDLTTDTAKRLWISILDGAESFDRYYTAMEEIVGEDGNLGKLADVWKNLDRYMRDLRGTSSELENSLVDMTDYFEDQIDALRELGESEENLTKVRLLQSEATQLIIGDYADSIVETYNDLQKEWSDFVSGLFTSDLAPVQSADLYNNLYTQKLATAAGGDSGALQDLFSFIQGDYLPFMKTYSGAGMDYKDIYGGVMGDITGMGVEYTDSLGGLGTTISSALVYALTAQNIPVSIKDGELHITVNLDGKVIGDAMAQQMDENEYLAA